MKIENMDYSEFDRVPQIIFSGISSVERIGTPGTLIPLTNDTRAVLCGEDSTDVVIVATRFGEGRCLIFAHNGYPERFLNQTELNRKFINNCRQWLAKGRNAEFLSINEAKSMTQLSTYGKILVWDAHYSKSDEFMNDLCAYLQSGGALICGTTPWGWLQVNKGKDLADFPFTRFCDNIGVKVTDNYSNCSDPIEFRKDLIKFKNIEHVTSDLADNLNLCIIGAVLKVLGHTVPGLPFETLCNIVMNASQDVIPLNTRPIRRENQREQSNGICGIASALPGIKAPGISHFPGDFDQPPCILTNMEVRIESKASQWYCTGYYVAAGIPIQIDVLSQTELNGWSARIGCHSDDLKNCDELRRWSSISVCKSLSNKTVQMHSAFGGLLFLHSLIGESNSITVKLHHVVLTPMYDTTKLNRAAFWKDMRSKATGLWADVAGQFIVFNLPSKSVLHLESDQLDRALQFWDRIVLAHHDLRGTHPIHRERIVCDEQPSVGYMHNGYPIVTHLDITDSKSNDFVFNIEELEKNGSWGLFHELGHNMQRGWWTFDGAGEVTVNIFTLHAMDQICHLKPFRHPWLIDKMSVAIEYIENGANFDKWKEDAGIALMIYAQLAREYGWKSYAEIFRKYEETKPILDEDQDKIDYWIITFSQQVDYNLIPLFKFWGFSVSEPTENELKNLPIPLICDQFISIAPECYGNTTRNTTKDKTNCCVMA